MFFEWMYSSNCRRKHFRRKFIFISTKCSCKYIEETLIRERYSMFLTRNKTIYFTLTISSKKIGLIVNTLLFLQHCCYCNIYLVYGIFWVFVHKIAVNCQRTLQILKVIPLDRLKTIENMQHSIKLGEQPPLSTSVVWLNS